MPDASQVALSLRLDDSNLDRAELETLTQSLMPQLQDITEDVERVLVTQLISGELVEKGEEKEPGLLQMEVNLENIQKLVSWLYQRIAGRSTKARLKFGEGSTAIEFEFEGNSQKDLAATLQDATAFVEKITQIQQAQQAQQ